MGGVGPDVTNKGEIENWGKEPKKGGSWKSGWNHDSLQQFTTPLIYYKDSNYVLAHMVNVTT